MASAVRSKQTVACIHAQLIGLHGSMGKRVKGEIGVGSLNLLGDNHLEVAGSILTAGV